MKIFSNFDTQRKQEALQEAREKFWEEHVFLLRKSGLFLTRKVILPVLLWTVIQMGVQIPLHLVLEEFGRVKRMMSVVLGVVYLFLISPNIKYYIDYTMDFSIVTPESLTRYNQTGFFKRDIKTSNVRNIKTISIQKNNFRYNVFDNGDLIFLSEGDKSDQGEITLHYIYDPEAKKKEISRVMRSLGHLTK